MLAGLILSVLSLGVTGAVLRSGDQSAAISPTPTATFRSTEPAVASSPAPLNPTTSPLVPAVGSPEPSDEPTAAVEKPRSDIRRSPTLPVTGVPTHPAGALFGVGAAFGAAVLLKSKRDHARR